jgi:deoxycytidylate deaminase
LSAPCRACAERIKKAEIKCVIYRHPYRNTDGLEELYAERYISVYRLTQSGYLINERTGQIEDA